MKRFDYFVTISIIAIMVSASICIHNLFAGDLPTPLGSTEVDQALKEERDDEGKITTQTFADGTTQSTAAGAAGGGWTDAGTTIETTTSTDNVGIGVTPGSANQLHLLMDASKDILLDGSTNPRAIDTGLVRVEFKPSITNTRCFTTNIDVNSMDSTHSTVANITANGLAPGETATAYQANLDAGTSTGGVMRGISISKSGPGSAVGHAIHVDSGMDVLSHFAGTFINVEQAWDENGGFTDVTAAFNATGTDVTIFDTNADKIHIGMAAVFNAIRINLDTFAGGAGIKPTFAYSSGGGTPVWTDFPLADGTQGLRRNGLMTWMVADLTTPTWAASTINSVSKFYIRITRTQASIPVDPVEDTIQVVSTNDYEWNDVGELTVSDVDVGSSVLATRSLTVDTGGVFNVALSAAAGDDFTVDTDKLVVEGDTGNVGIGVTDPDTPLEVLNAGNQLKLSFDGTDNTIFAVDTNGDMTITPSGTQIIVAGEVAMSANKITGLADPTLDQDATTKIYVDTASAAFDVDYFFNNTASDIGGIYFDMTSAALGGGESTLSTAGLTASTNDQALVNFLTDETGGLGILDIPAGTFEVHFHAERTAGNSTVNIYAEVYKRASGGAETLITTSQVSGAVTSKAVFSLFAHTGADTDLLATDRVLVKFLANLGSGSGATVAIYAEGTTVSRLAFPTTSEILNQIFIRQDGTKALNGTLTIKEQADADGDTAAHGQLWVNTATPNELWFTDDAGTDFELGGLVQYVNTQDGASNTGTTAIPTDDTIPQITEGDEYMTLAITPTSSASTLEIDVVFHGSHSGGNQTMTVGLFQDSTANALAVMSHFQDTAATFINVAFKHTMTAGTTSATTFRIRAGTASGATTTFNGAGGARYMGGVFASSITIKEIK